MTRRPESETENAIACERPCDSAWLVPEAELRELMRGRAVASRASIGTVAGHRQSTEGLPDLYEALTGRPNPRVGVKENQP